MISETVLLWVGTMALVINYVAIAKADNRLSAIIGHVFSLLFWIAFSISSLNYQAISGGTTIESSAQSLALIGLIGVVTTVLLLVDIVFGGILDTYRNG